MDNFVYDQPRLPIGHFLLSWPASSPLQSGSGRLHLYDGIAELNLTSAEGGGGVVVNLLVWANALYSSADVVVIEATVLSGSIAGLELVFVPEIAQSTWSGQSSAYVPNPPPLNSSAPYGSANATLNMTSQMHLRGTAHTTATLTVVSPSRTSLVCFASVSPVLGSAAEANAYASAQVAAGYEAGVAALRSAHASAWHAWWPAGGFVTSEYSVLESFWWIQLYKFGSAVRAGVVHDLEGPWFIDGTPWPDLHWDMNLQQTYYFPISANRPALAATLVDFVERVASNFNGNVPSAWAVDSAAAPTGASSLSGNMSCYWNYGPNCTTSPPSVTGNLLWLLQLVDLASQHSGNATVQIEVLFPLLTRALAFYAHFTLTNATSGEVSLPPTFSPEYPAPPGPNANYDISLYKWGLMRALALNEAYALNAPQAPAWSAALNHLVGYSVDAASNTFEIYEGVPYGTPHRHYSHLFMIFPLRLLNFSDAAQVATARASVNLWLATPEEDSEFYRPAASAMNVMLGQNAAAFDNITYLLHNRIEPNTFYAEGAAGSCTETPYAAAFAVNDWLLQSWRTLAQFSGKAADASTLVLDFFPGIDDVIRLADTPYVAAPARAATTSFFRLGTAAGYLASAAREVVSRNATHYVSRTSFLAIEVPSDAPQGSRCVVRTNMLRPLLATPSSVAFTELGEGLVEIHALLPGASVALASSQLPAPALTITAKDGCPANFNYWGLNFGGGGGQPMTLSSVSQPVLLAPCVFDGNGILSDAQRYMFNASSISSFALQDGSGRCLSLSTCSGANGDLVALAPCLSNNPPSNSSSSAPIGCEPAAAGCDAIQTWTLTGPQGSPPNAIQTALNNRCIDVNGALNPDIIDVWDCGDPPGAYRNEEWYYNATSGAIQSLDTDSCCYLKCLTPA